MTSDVLYGLRSFVRRPGFTSLVVVILALGIGFVTMIASLAHSVFLGRVPYDDPERIVVVWRQGPEPIHEREATSYLNILDWAAGGEPFFEGLAAYTIAPSSIVGADGAQRVMVTYVDPYFFEVLDVDMTAGRRLSDDDNRPPSGDAVVVLSHGLWQSALGGDPAVVGRTINLGGHLQTVVGVMSPRTRWLLHEPLEVVAPYRNAAVGMGADVTEDRGTPTSIAVGRLRKGVSLAQAQSGMQAVSRALQQQHPDTNGGIEARVTSFADLRSGFGRLSEVVTILGIAAGLVFFLSCASVTLLLLARFLERTREFAVRMALGAARHRFVTQAMAEGVALTLVAGAAGLGLAFLGIRLVFAGNPLNMFSFADVTVHPSVFVATLALALATTLLFGLVPVLRSGQIDFHEVLRPAGADGGGSKRHILQRGLIALQVGLSVVVLVGAGLVLRSLYMLSHTDYGFDTADLVYAKLLLDGPRYAQDDQARVFYRELEERLAGLPGVTDAGLWGPGLPGSSTWSFSAVPEGRESDPSFEGLHTWYHTVSPGALERVGLRLLEGRMLDGTDHANALPSVVVSETLARSLWPGQSALGKRMVDVTGQGWRTVVGVVSDARMRGVGRTHGQILRDCYLTLDQLPMANVNVFLRAQGDTDDAIRMVRDSVRAIDPTRPLFNVSSMSASMAEDRREVSFITTLMLLFAGAAVFLTALCLYSVMSYIVSRRTREIGVRVALGADRRSIVGLVLGQTALDMGVGLTIGLASSLAMSQLMQGLLYGVTPNDPLAFALVVPALLAVALAAALVPVRRALAIAPSEALRHE
jgi:putative ABC transport system permease protein